MGIVKIFVYGSLKNNFENNDILKKIGTYKTKAKTVKKFPMVINDKNGFVKFPYLLDQENTGLFINGEVWEIHHTKLKVLDDFESELFKRGIISVIDENDKIYTTQVYFKNKIIDFKYEDLIYEWTE